MVLALHSEGRTAAAEREPLGLAEGQKAGYCWWKSCCAVLAGGRGRGGAVEAGGGDDSPVSSILGYCPSPTRRV